MGETVWLGKREYEGRVVYEDVFRTKERAKTELAKKQGGKRAEKFNWEGLNWEGDKDEIVDDDLELGERLVVKRKEVKE